MSRMTHISVPGRTETAFDMLPTPITKASVLKFSLGKNKVTSINDWNICTSISMTA